MVDLGVYELGHGTHALGQEKSMKSSKAPVPQLTTSRNVMNSELHKVQHRPQRGSGSRRVTVQSA